MIPFNTLIKINRKSPPAIYQQVANAIVNLIHEAVIRPGSPLPSSREMAAILNVHRKTIVAAYEELLSQDWIVSLPRKGVSVSANLPELKPRSFRAAPKASPYENKILINKKSTLSPFLVIKKIFIVMSLMMDFRMHA